MVQIESSPFCRNYLDDPRPPLISSRRVVAGLRQRSASSIAFRRRRENAGRSLVRRNGAEAPGFRLELQFGGSADGRIRARPLQTRKQFRTARTRAGERFRESGGSALAGAVPKVLREREFDFFRGAGKRSRHRESFGGRFRQKTLGAGRER